MKNESLLFFLDIYHSIIQLHSNLVGSEHLLHFTCTKGCARRQKELCKETKRINDRAARFYCGLVYYIRG
jgi:hypothetical protein